MAKRTTTQAKPAASKARQPAPRAVTATQANIAKALKELGVNKPYYSCKVVGGRLKFLLYGGDIVFWPETASAAKQPPEKGSSSRAKGGN